MTPSTSFLGRWATSSTAYGKAASRQMKRLLIYPSFFDLVLIIGLYLATKSVIQDIHLALIGVVTVVILRFILAWVTYGVAISRTRNWYIKQCINMLASVLVVYVYSFPQFSWIFATYFASATLVEIALSITLCNKFI